MSLMILTRQNFLLMDAALDRRCAMWIEEVIALRAMYSKGHFFLRGRHTTLYAYYKRDQSNSILLVRSSIRRPS